MQEPTDEQKTVEEDEKIRVNGGKIIDKQIYNKDTNRIILRNQWSAE